jgi:hypothetical protein
VQHPYQQWPPRYREPQANYVGPTWAAPGAVAHPSTPSKRSGMGGCLAIAIALLVVFGGVVVVVAILLVSSIASLAPSGESGSEDHEPGAAEPAVVDPVSSTKLPIPRGVSPSNYDKRAERIYRDVGMCSVSPLPPGNPELRTSYNVAWRGRGTAKSLRKKVAVLSIRFTSPGLPWTQGEARDSDRVSLLAARFLMAQAANRQISDLQITPIAWHLHAPTLQLPKLILDKSNRVVNSLDVSQRLLAAAEGATGRGKRSLVQALKSEGYDEVAVLFHLPMVGGRDYAYPAESDGDVDNAFVFFQGDRSMIAATAVHETLHLFGADDLYPLSVFDPRDRNDVMREYCEGFPSLTIGDATAWAIGWLPSSKRPERGYPFR